MKYIKRRPDFLLEDKISLSNSVIKSKNKINESAVNDIPWGDSLVGRLINSFIRTVKIKYDATKIDTLQKDFKAQLDIIIAESISRDTRSEFLKLTIKSLLNDVNRTCTSTKDEKEKIKDLLGTDNGNSLWNPKKPNRGSFTENVDDGILLKIHDKIKLDLDEKQIEIAGTKKDDILASLSDLIDNLREYAWSLDNQGSSSSQSRSNKTFAVKFWGLMKRRKKQSVPQNASHVFKLKGYYNFIKENYDDIQSVKENSPEIEKGANLVFVENFRSVASLYQIYSEAKKKKEESKLSDRENKFRKDGTEELQRNKSSLTQNKNSVLSSLKSLYNVINSEGGKEAIKDIKNIQKLPSGQVMHVNSINKLYKNIRRKLGVIEKTNEKIEVLLGKESLANAIVNLYKNSKDANLDELGEFKENMSKFNETMKKCLDSNIFKQKVKQSKISSEKDSSEDYINSLINIEETDEEKIKEVVNKIPLDKKKELLNKIVSGEESNDEDKKEAKELLSELENSKNESLLIKESISSNDTIVNEIWRKWIKDADIPEELISVSQQEIDKLEEMIKGERSGQNLMFNPKKTPDPIINIVRIFKRAHDLYYTDVIPSGRSAGKVSNKTFREYEKLGTGQTSQSDANSPGYGPWAVKSIRNKWVDGVMQIIEDQEYRKVFANIKFVVAGSEDTFNENYSEYINLILEKEEEGAKSQGQILFDFITDMLSKETASNFDKERNTLLKKYFGSSVEIKGSDMKQVNVAPPDKPKDPVDDKTLYWESISQKRIDISRLKSDEEGPVLMFPYKLGNDPNPKILKFQVIKQISVKDSKNNDVTGYIIKTFKKVVDTEFYKNNYQSFKVGNDDGDGEFDEDKSYAVIFGKKITDISSGKKINIIFYENNNTTAKGEIDVTSSQYQVPSILYKKDKKEEQLNIKYKDITKIIGILSTAMEKA